MALFPSHFTWVVRLQYIVLHFANILHAANYTPHCNGGLYGTPVSVQCINAHVRFPIHDTAVHYFVEQQMRTAPPAASWNAFKDPRPPNEQQTIVQLPKWVSSGELRPYS